MEDKTYILMRKNAPLAVVAIDANGNIEHVSKEKSNEDQLPLQYRYQPDGIKKWWFERSVPINQGHIAEILKRHGYAFPTEYLVKNLGLSLTDYYWIKPEDSEIRWEDVNFFENDFKENVLWKNDPLAEDSSDSVQRYSPNSSLQGSIEKTWAIVNGERHLIKGNRTNLSQESINEVIASHLHKLQGCDNYVDYKLVRIKNKDYDFGCISKLFTSNDKELVPAYALYSSEKQENGVSPFEHFLALCKKHDVDMDRLCADLDYLKMTDYVLSGYDRHLNNIALIRNADSMKFERLAPIYDSGACLFVNKPKPRNMKDLMSIKTNGFFGNESQMLKSVRDRHVIDLTKLPPASYIKEMYGRDSQMSEFEINNIAHWYEVKIDLCRSFHLGKAPSISIFYDAHESADIQRGADDAEIVDTDMDL